MTRRITDWLRSESLPRNLYELLGHPLLDPDRDALLQTLRTANREVLDYQSHPEPAVSKRAIFLLTELGRYRGILEDPAKHQANIEEVSKTLRDQFVAERGPLALHAGNDLQTWLNTAFEVSPADAARIAALIRGNTQPPQVLPKRDKTKFAAFGTPGAEEPIAAEVVEVVEAPPAPVVVAEVYDLSDAPPASAPVAKPKRKPDRMEPVDLAPRKKKKKSAESESSLVVPLAIAGGVLMLLAIVTAVVIVVMDGPEKEKTVRNETPPPDAPPPEPKPDLGAEPNVPGSTQPKLDQKELDRLEKERKDREKKAEMDRIERDRLENDRIKKEREKERMDKERMDKLRMEKELMDKERMDKERMEKELADKEKERLEMVRIEMARKEDEKKNPWIVVEKGKGNIPVKSLVARVHSATIQKLTDTDKKTDAESGSLLVLWIEVLNQGDEARVYRPLIQYAKKADDNYEYCTLIDLSKNTDNNVKRAYWMTYDRKNVAELPNWSNGGTIAPKKRGLIPLVFEKPAGRQLTLTINAVRIASESGSVDDYGQYVLPVGEHHWKQKPPGAP